MRVYGYIRVSTADQADHGHSLPAQRDQLTRWATAQDVTLTNVFVDDGVSAKDLKRPAMEALLALVQAKQVDVIVTPKSDRFTRSLRDHVFLEDLFRAYRVTFIALNEPFGTTSLDQFQRNLRAALSELERKRIGERTAEVLRFKKRNGQQWTRTAPYGWRFKDKRVVEDENEQRTIRAAQALWRNGYSYRAMAAELTAQGHRTRTGGTFTHSAMRRLLHPPTMSDDYGFGRPPASTPLLRSHAVPQRVVNSPLMA